MSFKKLFLCAIIFITNNTLSRVSEEIKQVEFGNFALAGSQRQGPLLGFGQNILDKNNILGLVTTNFLQGKHQKSTTVTPQLLYGITDNFSLLIGLPISAQQKYACSSSSGPNDMFAQLECALHTKEISTATSQVTAVGTLYFPTGSFNKRPRTGTGSVSFFFGVTSERLATDWYFYGSLGAIITTKHHSIKIGNDFAYQTGVGRNIAYKTGKWLCSWLLELNGTYTQKARINGIKNNNSGGNIIFLCPSFWFSTPNFSLQAGVAPVIAQHNFGMQLKERILVSLSLTWKFH